MKRMTSYACQGCAIVLALAVLPGCGWFSKKDDAKKDGKSGSDQVLCTIDGKTVIKESDFIRNLNQMLLANPYLRGASIETLPGAIKGRVLDEMVKQELIVADMDKAGVEKDAEFIKSLDEMVGLVKRSLKVQFFEKKLFDGIKVSDADVAKHFEENKERYVKVAGGVLVAGASFANDAQANAFMKEVKGSEENFEKIAKAEKATFRDFGRVSKGAQGMSLGMTPAPVKEAALSMQKLPGVAKVKVGKEIWVIKAWDKKDTAYYELSEIRPQLEMAIKNNQARDVLEKQLKDLNAKFKVVVNKGMFEDKAAKEQAAQGAAEAGKDADDKTEAKAAVQPKATAVA